MPLPPLVHSTTSTFLAAIDASAPGLVEGLYLHGSLGFGEFFPDRSDVDFAAVLAERSEGVRCRPRPGSVSRFVAVREVAVGESPVVLVGSQSPGLVGSDRLCDPCVELREAMRP